MGGGTGSCGPVLVVDDDANCRALIVSLVDRIGCVTYQASTGSEALAVAETVRPSLVVLDVSIPGITGYEVCHELRERYGSAISVVFVSGSRIDTLDRIAGLLLGGDDYIVKPFDPDELVARLRRLIRRPSEERPKKRANGSSAIFALTPREREVLALLADGRNQCEIANELCISSKTVATHIQRLLVKLGVHSRAQAVAFAHREHLAEDDVEALVLHSTAVV